MKNQRGVRQACYIGLLQCGFYKLSAVFLSYFVSDNLPRIQIYDTVET